MEPLQTNQQNRSTTHILFILSIAQLFGLALWFAPNAVIDQMKDSFNLDNNDISRLSIAVTLGFVLGGFTFSVFNIPDIFKTKNFFFMASLLGGSANLIIAYYSAISFNQILLLRFFTGVFLAGIYPVGMKLTASHFQHNRGLAIGILLSALTAGSGLPYIFRIFGAPNWQSVFIFASIMAIFGGILVILFVDQGPYVSKTGSFDIKAMKTVYGKRSIRLANYGYFGHMWELYAMWVWIPFMLRDSYLRANINASDHDAIIFMSVGTFLVFFGGALANIFGGYFSDRIGRTKFNIIMLSISGSSGLVIGLFFGNPFIVLFIAVIWGITIVPDSPQYSTMITELADQSLVGSALTMQTAIGFALTIVSIQLIGYIQSIIDWQYTFMVLAIGPMLGIISMFKLRAEPDAKLIAQGNM